jgi:hypothetical protein
MSLLGHSVLEPLAQFRGLYPPHHHCMLFYLNKLSALLNLSLSVKFTLQLCETRTQNTDPPSS